VTHDEILTVAEVAIELRCSKAHVYNAIAGKVDGVCGLPAISMGRRKLVRRAALEQWKKTNETGSGDANMASSSAIDTVGRMKEKVHA
jgi:excisionase family DNA binding protein